MICCDRCKDKIPATRALRLVDSEVPTATYGDYEERFRAQAQHRMQNALRGAPPNGVTTFHLCLQCAAGAIEKLKAYIRQENPT